MSSSSSSTRKPASPSASIYDDSTDVRIHADPQRHNNQHHDGGLNSASSSRNRHLYAIDGGMRANEQRNSLGDTEEDQRLWWSEALNMQYGMAGGDGDRGGDDEQDGVGSDSDSHDSDVGSNAQFAYASTSAAVALDGRAARSSSSVDADGPSISSKKKKRRLSIEAKAAGVFLSPASSSVNSKISCSECRTSKTRCSGGDVCDRCKRLGRECIYKEHRRGRFSDNPRIQHLEKTIEDLLGQIHRLQQGTGGPASTRASTSFVPSPSSSNFPSSFKVSGSARADAMASATSSVTSASASATSTAYANLFSSLHHPFGSPAHESPDQLGQRTFPSRLLSQPLELLAYARHQAFQADPTKPYFQAGMSQDRLDPNNSDHTTTGARPPLSKSTLPGTFEPKLDHFDPIENRIITLVKAEALFALYIAHLDEHVTLLDPILHTSKYIRSHSSFLLTVICFTASLFDVDSAQLSLALEKHLHDVILPAILRNSYRSVEIVQAFVLLANYHPATELLADDRSWHYIGHAARIGSELGMNRLTYLSAARQEDEALVRRMRNRERTWLNVWTGEMVLCEQLGRLPLLRVDPLIVSSGGWHFSRFAIPADSDTVCMIQMRMIILRQTEMCERILTSTQGNNQASFEGMVQLTYRNAVEQLDAWLATWTHSHRSDGTPGHSVRLARARAGYWYGRTLLATRALHFYIPPSSSLSATLAAATTTNNRSEMMHELYRDAFQSCIASLNQYVGAFVPQRIIYGHNITIVAPAYSSVVCLHVLASVPNAAEELHVAPQDIFNLIARVADALIAAAFITGHRRGGSEQYGPFLHALVMRTSQDMGIDGARSGEQMHGGTLKAVAPVDFASASVSSSVRRPDSMYDGKPLMVPSSASAVLPHSPQPRSSVRRQKERQADSQQAQSYADEQQAFQRQRANVEPTRMEKMMHSNPTRPQDQQSLAAGLSSTAADMGMTSLDLQYPVVGSQLPQPVMPPHGMQPIGLAVEGYQTDGPGMASPHDPPGAMGMQAQWPQMFPTTPNQPHRQQQPMQPPSFLPPQPHHPGPHPPPHQTMHPPPQGDPTRTMSSGTLSDESLNRFIFGSASYYPGQPPPPSGTPPTQ